LSNPSKRRIRLLLAAAIAGVAAALAVYFFAKPWPEISRAEFLVEVRSGHVQEVEIHDGDTLLAVSSTRGRFRTAIKSSDQQLIAELQTRGIKVLYSSSGPTP